MKNYIPKVQIGQTVWIKIHGFPDKIHICSIDYITLYKNGTFKYHLTGFVGEFEEKELNVGWPVM